MPLLPLHAQVLQLDDIDPALRLYLPSSLPDNIRSIVCSDKLIYTEKELRIAQLDSQLAQLRKHLRYRSRGFVFKRTNITGQRPATRTHAVLGKITKKITLAATGYRRAREALVALDPAVVVEGHPQSRFEPLLETHIVGPLGEREDLVNSQGKSKSKSKSKSNSVTPGEGMKIHSWIWNMRTASEENAEKDDSGMFHDFIYVLWYS
jgi:hypothetical protein